MLKFVSASENPGLLRTNPAGEVITQILVAETAVSHSGRYKCEPGAAPHDQVVVHVLDGKWKTENV